MSCADGSIYKFIYSLWSSLTVTLVPVGRIIYKPDKHNVNKQGDKREQDKLWLDIIVTFTIRSYPAIQSIWVLRFTNL